MSETEHDAPARVRGFEATVSIAIEKATETSRFYRRFDSGDVQGHATGNVPDRTMRRAINDARELGWVQKKRQQWVPGERAEEIAGVDDED
jgi:hypothetical protein